jgi:peptidoglycan-associated lipoprotein
MAGKNVKFMVLVLLVCGMVGLMACAGHKAVKEGSGQGDATSGQKMTAEEEAIFLEEKRAQEAFVNEDVYFDFDQSLLTAAACEVLERKASWLNANSEATVTIEGHCDERGTAEYNIALGEQRARGAKAFLVDLGIASDRISTVSYGEEQPADPGHDEGAWAKNRRAHFVIH